MSSHELTDLQEAINKNLKQSLKTSFGSMDRFTPGDDDVEYDLEESREWIRYAVISLKNAKKEIETAIDRLTRIDCTIEKKLENAYFEPDYEAVFN